MAKLRCPVCGATHKDDATRCRLCGASMDNPATLPGNVGVKQVAAKKGGLSVVVLLGIGGVILIGAVAVVLGFGGSDKVVDKVKQEVPALNTNSEDGWQTVDDADGGFTASMPGQPDKGFTTYPAAVNGRASQLVSPLGPETDLSISYAKVTPPAGTTSEDKLRTLADSWATALNGTLEKGPEETSYGGYPALIVTIKGLRQDDQYATARAMIVLKGDTAYIVQSQSIYPDHPNFSRLASSLTFTS